MCHELVRSRSARTTYHKRHPANRWAFGTSHANHIHARDELLKEAYLDLGVAILVQQQLLLHYYSGKTENLKPWSPNLFAFAGSFKLSKECDAMTE